MCMTVHRHMYLHLRVTGASRGQREHQIPLQLELQWMWITMWVLGNEPGHSGRAARAPTHCLQSHARFYFIVSRQDFSADQASIYLTQRSACFCLLSARIKGAHHHHHYPVLFYFIFLCMWVHCRSLQTHQKRALDPINSCEPPCGC